MNVKKRKRYKKIGKEAEDEFVIKKNKDDASNAADSDDTGDDEIMKKKMKRLEIIIAVFLGLAAFLSAWATWIGSLHAGLQAIHFTESNNYGSQASALYNESSQLLLRDIMTWNNIQNYAFDYALAEHEGNQNEAVVLEAKVEALIDNCSDEFKEAVKWALENEKSPFEKEGFVEKYYAEASNTMNQCLDTMEVGKQDNTNSDTYGLVQVIYSIVLFLLGIANIFKEYKSKVIIVAISVGLTVFDFIFMLTIPMPKNFDLFSYLVTFVK